MISRPSSTPEQALAYATWRAWSGTADKADTRELPNGSKPFRWVRGRHFEKLDGALYLWSATSGATDCNLLTW